MCLHWKVHLGKPRSILSVYFLIIASHGTANYWAVQWEFTRSFFDLYRWNAWQ